MPDGDFLISSCFQHLLIAILLWVRAFCLICSLVHLFQYGLTDYCFSQWIIVYYYCFWFWYSHCPTYGQWDLLQTHLALSLSQSWDWPFLQVALFAFNEEWYLESKIWVLWVCCIQPFSAGRAKKYMYVHMYMHTHKHIYSYLSSTLFTSVPPTPVIGSSAPLSMPPVLFESSFLTRGKGSLLIFLLMIFLYYKSCTCLL